MRHLKTFIKILISVSLLSYLIYRAEPRKIWEVFTRVDATHGLWHLFWALLFILLAIFIMSFRWQVLLKGYHADVKLSRLFGFYLIGMFFNNFLPTSIGGDLMRIYKVNQDTGDRTTSFASVIIERMLGIAATLLLAIIALFFVSQRFHSKRLVLLSIALFTSILVFFVIIIQNRPFKLVLKMFDKFTIFSIGEKLNKLFEAIHHFSARRRVLIYVFILSLASQASIVMMNYFLALAFDLHIELSYLFMVVPVTFVLTMLPSINGVGIRDLGFVSLLGRIGISSAAAISLSFMNLIIPMVISAWGAVLFILQKKQNKLGEHHVAKNSD